MPLVSIVIPVFNVAIYLEELIKGLLGQTYKNIELIFVDDGSTDNSAEIIKSFAKDNERIHYIYQENQYGGVARNNGISVAKGKYLICLDADDIYEPNMIEKLCEQAEKTDADITICYFDITNLCTGHKSFFKGLNLKNVPDKEVFSKDDVEDIFEITNPGPCNKLYKTEFVKRNNLKYSSTKCINDLSFSKISLMLAERITTVKESLSTYRYLSPASSSLYRGKFAYQCFVAFDEIYSKIKESKDFEKFKNGYVKFVVGSLYYESSFIVDDAFINEFRNYLKKEPFSLYSKKEIQELFRVKRTKRRYVNHTILCVLTLGLVKTLKAARSSFKNVLKNYKSVGIL